MCSQCFECIVVFSFKDRGKVLATGDNKMGQLGIGNQTQQVPCPMQVCRPVASFLCMCALVKGTNWLLSA